MVPGRQEAGSPHWRKASGMDCPKCKAPMMIVEYEGVELDYCAACEGVWFDRDELEQLFEGLGPEAGQMLPRDMAQLPEAQTQEKKRRCPVCRKRMRKALIGPRGDVLIDTCPSGDGLWFDSNEVAELAEEVTQALPAAAGRAISFMGRVFRGPQGHTSDSREGKET